VWNILGVCLGASAMLISVLLHELGHLGAAKAMGASVTRFFVGFGPTVWSRRRENTEFGIKALPLGGFVTIAGAHPEEEDAADPRALWRLPAWRRVVIMASGPVVHMVLGFLVFWALAATLALPNPDNPGPNVTADAALARPAFVSVAPCLDAGAATEPACAQPGPAWTAGLRDGDRITRVGQRPVRTYGDLAAAIRTLPADQPVTLTYIRGSATKTTTLTPASAVRPSVDDPHAAPSRVPVLGVGLTFDPSLPRTLHYNVLAAAPVAASWVGIILSRAVTVVSSLPQQVSGLWHAVTDGGRRDPRSPVSVVGVSRISGQMLAAHDYSSLFGVIAAMNIFLGLFNLLPLPPLDGGRIATDCFSALRSHLPRRRRLPVPNPALLTPLTYMLVAALGVFSLLVIAADLVNPINLAR
jgi:membrane-associated protease RseP (regulator of RpoE activity)